MDARVVVVGGGVMGLATAWRLALRGVEVVLLEQYEVGHDRGSSHGPTRIFRYLYNDPVYVRMAQAAFPMWRELEDDAAVPLLNMTGGVYADAPELLAMHRDAMRACGASVEELTVDERRVRFPWLDAGDLPALFVPDLGVLHADAVVRSLRERVDVRENVRVEAIDEQGRVSTADGTIDAGTVVVASGGWTAPLLAPLGIDVPLRVTSEQVVFFETTEDMVSFVHGTPFWIYAVAPFERGGPFKVAEHGTGPEVIAGERRTEPDDERAERVAAYVRAHLPTVKPEPIGSDTCLYSTTPDGDFVLDRRGPIVVCSPCSGHGFKFAPLIGEIAASLATDSPPPVPIDRFALDRFTV